MNTGFQADELIGIRRHLHANPELSFKEHRTASFIEERLQRLGVSTTRCAETGVVALVEGAHPGPTLLFRADIDALPIHELNHVDYRSAEPGVMHACGHDVHTTVGLGLAAMVAANRSALHGRVKFVFQPAEEASPVDAPIGAERMVVEGVLDNPKVDAAFAYHVMPALDVGHIGYTGGPVWARSDLVEIELHGSKAHAAYPHEGIDAVVVAAHLVTALQTITSRRIDAREACVLSFGKLEAGNSYNIIADTARLTGILRTLSDPVADQAQTEISRIIDGVAAAFGAQATVKITPGARLTANHPGLEARVVSLLRERVGEAVVAHPPQLGAEDFASFSRRVPSCYLFIGVRNAQRGITHALHTPYFDVDEACLPLAVEAMGHALLNLGKNWSPL